MPWSVNLFNSQRSDVLLDIFFDNQSNDLTQLRCDNNTQQTYRFQVRFPYDLLGNLGAVKFTADFLPGATKATSAVAVPAGTVTVHQANNSPQQLYWDENVSFYPLLT